MAIPRLGVINLHPGLLPQYRAFGGYFWPLVEGSPDYGYTIHYINDVIDGGDIILRQSCPIPADATVQKLYYLSLKKGADGLARVIEQFRDGTVKRQPQSIEGFPCRPWPDAAALRRLRQKGCSLFKLRDLWEIYRDDF